MKDSFGRDINYMRLSVTDLCNLRCIYCMPESGVEKLRHEDILAIEEIESIVRTAAALGIKKVRLTGGEPLVRKGIVDIVARVAATPGVEETVLTTNGTLLPEYALDLKRAGLARVNISMDSLNADEYSQITRGGELDTVLAGIRAAAEAGLTPIKVNCVLIGGINEDGIKDMVALTETDGISIQFIEIMPIGECAGWNHERFVDLAKVLEVVPELEYERASGVADVYRKPGAAGTVGLIHPISCRFCDTCNKIRVTADGKLKPCLHSADEIPLRGLSERDLYEAMRGAILGKPERHALPEDEASGSLRGMSAIGG